MKKNENKKYASELRLDVNSKNWVVIATGRAKRPEMFKNKNKVKPSPKKNCFFCNIETQEKPIIAYSNNEKMDLKNIENVFKNWTTIVIPNKYPAFTSEGKLNRKKESNLFEKMNAIGCHEVVVTRDHHKPLWLLPIEHVKELIDTYSDRFNFLSNKKNISYVSIFHNHGPEAGASVYHPHSQIIGLPLIDSDLEGALRKAKNYSETKSCVYCEMNRWEIKKKERIVYENKDFIAVCPFASKVAFQIIISPKKHLSKFELIKEEEKKNLADMFKKVLTKLDKALDNPPFNFYLHSAPSDGGDHSYYHWHWTILPKTSIWAGFELGVGIEISTIEPEKAAEYLRKQ
jgi:UDPglucose--hexose-1-phosphate uridylyltransferase